MKYLRKQLQARGLQDHCRICCAGHIINLVVKATIYGKGVSKWELNIARAAPQEQFKLFYKQGVVGKLYNFVLAIFNLFKKKELFDSIQQDL